MQGSSGIFKSKSFIEPVVMLLILAWSIVYGSETTTNLTMWKFCRMELNYTEEICSNLSNGEGF